MSGEDFLPTELADLAASIDIPPSKYAEAVKHYEAVGNWLVAEGTSLAGRGPEIYVQGSFRLGTVVRPIRSGKASDYDIDLVCNLHQPGAAISPRDLKKSVGQRLMDNETYNRMLDPEGRRCWTLQYAASDGIGFHLDVLPAAPATLQIVEQLRTRSDAPNSARDAIEITEKEEDVPTYKWVPGGSNPRGYAKWFDGVNERARLRVSEVQKQLLFEANREVYRDIEEVPDALLRTPLQRAIQLLKRHRDARFSGHDWEKEKPISIIITTLAARAYQDEDDPWNAMLSIAGRFDEYATNGLIERVNGAWWVRNPVNHEENFADRWNDPGSDRANAFFEWLSWLQRDLSDAADREFSGDRAEVLNEAFGVGPGGGQGSLVGEGSSLVPALADASHRLNPGSEFSLNIDACASVKVKATIHRFRYGSRSGPLKRTWVRKNRWLRFRVDTNVARPFDVKWQVVNTGKEAAAAGPGELRGGFLDGNDSSVANIRWEQTKYAGTHWVEAFVLRNGECVARSGRFLVKIR